MGLRTYYVWKVNDCTFVNKRVYLEMVRWLDAAWRDGYLARMPVVVGPWRKELPGLWSLIKKVYAGRVRLGTLKCAKIRSLKKDETWRQLNGRRSVLR